jgi:hypothetical protein
LNYFLHIIIAIDVVNTLVTKFEALSAPRYDVLAKVKAISENSAAILEAGFPVASLALANLNITNQANLSKSQIVK